MKKTSIVKQNINLDNQSKGKKKKKKKKKKSTKNKFQPIQNNEVSSSTALSNDQMPDSKDFITSQSIDAQKGKEVNFSHLWLNYKPRSTPLIRAEHEWHLQLITEESKTLHTDSDTEALKTDSDTKCKLKELAVQILQHDVANYNRVEETGLKMQEVKFRKTILSHGTSRDKLATHVLRCMEAPVHSLNHLNALIAMVSTKAKREYEEALSSLLELFESTFLPDGRTARKFEAHNFFCLKPMIVTNHEVAEKQLALWYFEDQLAHAYQKLVRQLAQVSHDTLDQNKMKGVWSLLGLLTNNPNQEVDFILECVINKLGDPSRKVAAKTMYCLRVLLQRRPVLKERVVTSVETMLFRPNVSEKAQYYCLCFLKDMIFSSRDRKLAINLIKLYFGFFKACTKKGEVDTRLMAALLRGINRAFPFSGLQGSALEEQLDTLYKLCHFVNFAIATQALQLIYQLLSNQQQVSERFYLVLYRHLQDPAFGNSSASTACLNLVFRALINDDSLHRIQAFIKRLLQTCLHQSSHLACGILYLIGEVIQEKPELKNMNKKLLPSSLCDDDDDGLEVFTDAEDLDEFEVKEEESKRDYGNDHKEKMDTTKKNMENLPRTTVEESHFNEENATQKSDDKSSIFSSWVHHYSVKRTDGSHAVYDPYHRNPSYCGAEYSHLWELGRLKEHYHPSVSLFACRVISGEAINYSGDPLHDFTLMRFLDRFVYRNPKKVSEQKDDAGGKILGLRSQYIPSDVRRVAVNTEKFVSLDPKEVPEDEQFFHRYFSQYKGRIQKQPEDEQDDISIDDEEIEQHLNRMKEVDVDGDSEMDGDLDFAAGAVAAHVGKNDVGTEEELSENDGSVTDENSIDGDNEEQIYDDEIDDSEWQHFTDDDEMDCTDDDKTFDEERTILSDDDSFEFSKSVKKRRSGNFSSKQKPSKKRMTDSLSSMFASAESFAHLLEENEEKNMNPITLQSFANKDRAHTKQLSWEAKRHENIKGIDWRKMKGNHRHVQQQNENFTVGKARSQLRAKRGGRKKFQQGKIR
ncbi:CCAAT/enhancer-binding protein zeta-like isoform X2 [Panulirus ornatus]